MHGFVRSDGQLLLSVEAGACSQRVDCHWGVSACGDLRRTTVVIHTEILGNQGTTASG